MHMGSSTASKQQKKTGQDAVHRANKNGYGTICATSVPEKHTLDRHYKTKTHLGNVAAAVSRSSAVLG